MTRAWANPPRDKASATVHITEPGGHSYTLTARRSRGQLIATFAPGALPDGKLCARYQGSSRTACVQIIDRP
ncbi:hypothetical protein ACFWRV_06790 [Streptomyces sp. NPDC058576]|uniref:hypothetical protein n=1 Tax=Streptomyces sp. NPDC058576 TaxID=3346547 RepID=UPI00364AEA7B